MSDNRPVLDQLLDLLNVSTYGEIVPAVKELSNKYLDLSVEYNKLTIQALRTSLCIDELLKYYNNTAEETR